MAKKCLHFTYASIGNMCRLLLNIQFEKSSYYDKYMLSWKSIFDTESGETLIENFLEKLYPEGCTIGLTEINKLLEVCVDYLENSEEENVRNAVNEDVKRGTCYWVYSKYNNTVYPCDFGGHTDTVAKVVAEFYGKNLVEMTDEQVEKFILSNFEIRSDNLTIEMIARGYNVKIDAYAHLQCNELRRTDNAE